MRQGSGTTGQEGRGDWARWNYPGAEQNSISCDSDRACEIWETLHCWNGKAAHTGAGCERQCDRKGVSVISPNQTAAQAKKPRGRVHFPTLLAKAMKATAEAGITIKIELCPSKATDDELSASDWDEALSKK
jgi:hypothetical protein